MKTRLISNFLFICCIAFFCLSCRQEKRQVEQQDDQHAFDDIKTVVSIGKVTPEDGWVSLSTSMTGIVDQILVSEGDSVIEGQDLFILKSDDIRFDVNQAEAQLEVLKAQVQAFNEELAREEVLLASLQKKFNTSYTLFMHQAETRENMDADESSFHQQRKRVGEIRQEIVKGEKQKQEQLIVVEKAKSSQKELIVKAARTGVITELQLAVGQSLSGYTDVGKIADVNSLHIEAEVDELFADQIQVGQAVRFYRVDTKDSIGQGVINYLSPTLTNKSILYENANEAQDRRVRRIHVKPEKSSHLLVNAKLECIIEIR
ncbi:HlyD family secretion protein [Sphingobacterium sp. LRF_L2]|uniref:HlyD family secretion protein n=1 Tax=Sphingobacterium sp. LRF_L2 TaxID=3369421 RepID=UPI003F5D576D